MRRFCALIVCSCLCLGWTGLAWADPGPPPVADPQVAAPPPAQAVEPPKTEAEKLADQGRDAYRTGNYAEGYRSFERAFVLDDNSRWLYNMAKCKEKLADYKSAVRLLERYLEHHKQAHGGQAPTDAVDAEHLIRDLKQRAFEQLPEVEIKSSPVGAQVLMADGTTIGSTPVTTHMEPGNYKITLKLPNHSEVQAELVVPLAGKRDGGGEAGVTGAGNADGERAKCGHESVADRLLKMITIRHAR